MSSVGQAVGGLVGGIVGFFTPLGPLYGAQLGMMVGGYIDPPKGPTINGPRLNDLSVQTSTYGAALPRIYGTVATHGNVFWLENNKLKERVKKEEQGGKGGGGGSTVKTYTYFATFAVGLADTRTTGPIAGVRRIWVGGRLIYDAGSNDVDSIIASNNAAQGFRVYTGAEDQLPDTRMQADVGAANCPAYRGVAYIVFYDFALKDYGNSLMAAQVKVEVVSSGNFSIPRNVGSIPAMVGEVVNCEDGIITTAEVGPYFFAVDPLDSTDKFNGSIIFREYRAGVQVSTYTVYEKVPVSGTSKSTANGYPVYFKALPIRGVSGEMFVINTFTDIVAFSALDSTFHIPLSTEEFGVSYYKANGKYYLPYSGGFAIFDTTSGSYTLNTVPGGANGIPSFSYQGIKFAHDRETGSIYFHARTNNSGFSVLVEIDEYGNQINATEFSGGVDYYPFIDNDRLVMALSSVPYTVRIYDKNGAGWDEVGNALGGPGNAYFYGAGVALIGSNLWQVTDYLSGNNAALPAIIQSECLQSGLLSALDIDVSDISQDVRGYRVAESGAIRGALEPLQGAWPFDVIQSGYQIKFVRRGKTSVATIDAQELDARPYDTAPGVQITLSHEMDTQLPRKVAIRYMDANREYDTSEQNAERLNTDAVNIREMELPIVLSATEAAGMSEVLLYLYWLERRDISFKLPPQYRYLEPTDVITITGEWGQYELRLTRINLESDGRLACSAKFNAAAIYTPTAEGAEGDAPEQTVPLDGPSLYILLDVPLLADAYNSPGWPAAMAGYTSGWPGGIIYRSTDGGATWSDLQGFTSPVTLGYARNSIGAGRFDIVDASSVLDVDMLAGDLSSITELAQLNGGNLLAYGAPGRWEICSPRTVELQADGSLKLSDWMRGRFGTEWAAALHEAGDALVLMTDPDLAWIPSDTASIGLARDYRGITSGRSIDSDTTRSETYEAVNLTPLSPVYLNGSRHPTTRDWALTWTRRGRVSPEWRNSVDVPIGEDTEAYEIDIYDGSGYATVKRTLTASSATVAYTSAEQVADFGSNQSTLYLKVYQMSATVGRGYPLTESITRG